MNHPPDPGSTPGDAADLEPWLPGLLDGLSALEPLSDEVVELLAAAGLGSGARVLDPACGRGGAAISLAVRLGAEVDGVDESDALVTEAETEARRRGLPCRFRRGEPLDALQAAAGNPRDAVLWRGMGRALGRPDEAVALLRRAVRPGGLLLVEDGFLREGVDGPPPGHEGYGPRSETLAGLCAHGDLVVGELVAPDEAVRDANRRDLEALRARAAALAVRQPELSPALRGWLEAQAAQVVDLERTLRSATWLLRRGEA